MHELSLVSALLESIDVQAREHAARSVRNVRLRVGELAGVDPELLRTAFEVAREGTLCSEAALDLTFVGARWVCLPCGRGLENGDGLVCPQCGTPLRLEAGDELVLESLELEVPNV